MLKITIQRIKKKGSDSMQKKIWQRRTLKYGLIGLTLYLIYIAAFGLIPYAFFPDVNQQFKNNFEPATFYGTDVSSVDRAGIMEMGEVGLEARIGIIHSARSSLDVSYYSTHWATVPKSSSVLYSMPRTGESKSAF
ncbi:hypothetical protein RE628_23145 [Paenibacillus sp. D2_2]|uniref:hypothetical protein n=1 Tax=Paenibacillus sp. D2_2 TaxID=3073092 RepID=UPI0028153FBC|nr:hypothetical protein [Paenibacillus sp. D2_2]WMT40148.1 hypothetical protein RE628_23145 [Paenibacillus sp. D2_2]